MSSEDASRSAADTATTGPGAEPPTTAATPTPEPAHVQRGPNAESAPDPDPADTRPRSGADDAASAEPPVATVSDDRDAAAPSEPGEGPADAEPTAVASGEIGDGLTEAEHAGDSETEATTAAGHDAAASSAPIGEPAGTGDVASQPASDGPSDERAAESADTKPVAANASGEAVADVEPVVASVDPDRAAAGLAAAPDVPVAAATTSAADTVTARRSPAKAAIAAQAPVDPATERSAAEAGTAEQAPADVDATTAEQVPAEAGTAEQSTIEAGAAEQVSADEQPPPDAATTEQQPADPDSADPEVGRWRRFASTEPAPEPESGPWPKRALRRTGRALRGENAIAALVSVVLALAMNWRVLRDPMHTIPHDLGDPLQQTYTLAWPGEILLRDPSQLFNAGIFYPNRLSFAFTDTLLGYAPASLIGSGTEAALLRYNIVYLFTFALAFFGMYVLLRQLGARVAGSAVGAAAVAFAPWKLAQEGHLNIMSIGGIALALAMLARGHGYSLRDGYRPERVKWGWVIGGWLVAAWQVSLGFGIGVGFGYLLAGIAVVAMFVFGAKNIIASVNKRIGPRVGWRILVCDLVGMLVFAGTSLVLAIPYFQVLKDHPEAERSLEEVDFFSPVWSSFLISPEESAIWGESHAAAREGMPWPPETTLLLGFTILALALVGLVWSSWTQRQRVFLAVGVAFSLALAMGTNFLDKGAWVYALAFEYLPGFNGLRTPGRLVLYTSILLAILAAGTLTRLADRLDDYAAMDRVDTRFRAKVPAPVRVILLLPLLMVLSEGYGAVDPKPVPEPPVAMSELDDPVLVLPAGGGHDWSIQYWSVDGFPRIVNGSAAFTPANQEEIRQHALTFPSAKSVADLRADGIRTVVAVRDMLEGSDWDYLLDIPGRDPTVTVEDRGAVLIFTL